jgi:hypothetical protein
MHVQHKRAVFLDMLVELNPWLRARSNFAKAALRCSIVLWRRSSWTKSKANRMTVASRRR